MVHYTLDDAMDGVQEVGVLAHGQHSVDLGVQEVVAEREKCREASHVLTPFTVALRR